MKRSLRILIVDDDADNANSLGELFELEGTGRLSFMMARQPLRPISRKTLISHSWM